METKLTLKLDKRIIEEAKQYAAQHRLSLSRIVEAYLQSLTINSKPADNELEITPFVKSMSTGVKIPADLDYKKEHLDFLVKKYR